MFLLYANPILIAAAVIPAVVLLVWVYKSDRLERESQGLLLRLVLAGVVAALFSMVTERIGSRLLNLFFGNMATAYNVLMYFGVVACSEEGFKYLLMKRRTWESPEFNCQFDGVVYAVFVSLGFALFENIGYVISYGFTTALLRAVTAIPGHACFGVFMGCWYGMARRYRNYGQEAHSKACRIMAFVLPVLLHGAYDYIASMQSENSTWIFIVFIVIIFFVAFRMVKKLSANDHYI